MTGRQVSIEKYPALYGAIGGIWDNGQTPDPGNFFLPDFNYRFLEGTADRKEIGQYVSPGLPNISGQAGIGDNGNLTNPSKLLAMNTCSGALFPSASGTQFSYSNTHSTAGVHYGGLAFDASRCSDIYKNDFHTVQPPAGVVIYLIKY